MDRTAAYTPEVMMNTAGVLGSTKNEALDALNRIESRWESAAAAGEISGVALVSIKSKISELRSKWHLIGDKVDDVILGINVASDTLQETESTLTGLSENVPLPSGSVLA